MQMLQKRLYWLTAVLAVAGSRELNAQSLSNVLERMDKALMSMPYVQSRHAVYKVNSRKEDTLLARWEGGFTPDGKEFVKGGWTHIPNYSEVFAYDGKRMFSYCPEQRSGCILGYGDSFNLRRGPRALLGGWYENERPMRLNQLLASAEDTKMSVEMVGGQKTFRIEGTTDVNGQKTLVRAWVSPDRDYLPIKSALAYPKTGIETAIASVDRWEKVAGRWFPVEGRIEVYAVNPKMAEGSDKWSQKETDEYLARRDSWDIKPLDDMFAYEKIVVANVKVLPKAPGGVFDIVFPRGARVFNKLVNETTTVGAPGSAFDLGTVLGQQKVSGAKLAEASEKRLQQNKAPNQPSR